MDTGTGTPSSSSWSLARTLGSCQPRFRDTSIKCNNKAHRQYWVGPRDGRMQQSTTECTSYTVRTSTRSVHRSSTVAVVNVTHIIIFSVLLSISVTFDADVIRISSFYANPPTTLIFYTPGYASSFMSSNHVLWWLIGTNENQNLRNWHQPRINPRDLSLIKGPKSTEVSAQQQPQDNNSNPL
jgi:hypothetical protein